MELVASEDVSIYRQLRIYQRNGDSGAAQRSLNQLSKNKQKNVNMLLKRTTLVERFDALIPIEGLWLGEDMLLGDLCKLLALHCDEELACYLKDMYDGWFEVHRGQEHLIRAIDRNMVISLQAKVPGLIKSDRSEVRKLFDEDSTFTQVTGKDRDELCDRICYTKRMFTSFRTFFQDCIYFSICQRVMITLLPKFNKGRNGNSVKTQFRQRFQPSNETTCFVEVSEGQYEHLPNQGDQFHQSYLHLWLFAMRHWWEMTVEEPLKRPKGENRLSENTPIKKLGPHLARLALKVGFILEIDSHKSKSKSIREMSKEESDGLPESSVPVSTTHISSRYGKPHARDLQADQSLLFLPTIIQCRNEDSVLFFRRCFVSRFFGSLDKSYGAKSRTCEPTLTLQYQSMLSSNNPFEVSDEEDLMQMRSSVSSHYSEDNSSFITDSVLSDTDTSFTRPLDREQKQITGLGEIESKFEQEQVQIKLVDENKVVSTQLVTFNEADVQAYAQKLELQGFVMTNEKWRRLEPGMVFKALQRDNERTFIACREPNVVKGLKSSIC